VALSGKAIVWSSVSVQNCVVVEDEFNAVVPPAVVRLVSPAGPVEPSEPVGPDALRA
jgi:hypothetical protein